jgi:single-strand DNA-binding protein
VRERDSDEENTMNETTVTVLGYVGTDPTEHSVGETSVATFRLASTPRVFRPRENTWADRETNWFTVNAWRALAQHVMTSVHQSEPVIVHGRLRAQAWKDDAGIARTTMVLDALTIGHDLSKGDAAFIKSTPSSATASAEEQTIAEANAALEGAGGQVTSDGRFLEEAVPEPAPF